MLEKSGNRLKYVDSNGVEHLEFRKKWVGEKLDMLMEDFTKLKAKGPVKVNTDEVDEPTDNIEEQDQE